MAESCLVQIQQNQDCTAGRPLAMKMKGFHSTILSSFLYYNGMLTADESRRGEAGYNPKDYWGSNLQSVARDHATPV